MPKRLIIFSRTQPSRTIIGVIAVITFLAGLWLMTPWALTTLGGPSVSVGFDVGKVVGAFINCLFCLPAFYGVKKNTPKDLSRGAFWLFFWYCFVTLLRIILSPAGSLVFIPTLIIALIAGVVYLEQSYIHRQGGRNIKGGGDE